MSLEVSRVSVRFGGLRVLTDVSLTAQRGHITGLIGPNGAGKTTLFNVISGLLRPLAGSVRLSGRDLTALAPYQRARFGLTRTFQRLELFGSLTVRENLLVACSGRSDPERAVAQILDRLHLTSVAEQRGDELPTGLGRLVELGRCVATDPTVLLLDEPASGQTERETSELAKVLIELAGDGIAILLVEHDIELVTTICTTVTVLDMGRVIASGPIENIRRDQQVQDAYLGAQVTT